MRADDSVSVSSPETRGAMQALIRSLVLADGWRRLLIAFVAGALAALALAPLNVFFVMFISLSVLVLLLDGAVGASRSGKVRRFRPAFGVGWAWGFGYFVAGLWWTGAALLVDGDRFALFLPLAVAALPAGLALFTGLATGLARMVWPQGWRRIVALAIALALADYARGHVLTGFPWNLLGHTLGVDTLLMQGASVVGVYGLGFLAVLIFAAPAALTGGGRGGPAYVAAMLALFVGLAGFGVWRTAGPGPGTHAEINLRIMQPRLGQLERFEPDVRAGILRRYFALSAGMAGPAFEGKVDGVPTATPTSGMEGVDILIWPESAFPYLLADQPGALPAIAEFLPLGTTLITGGDRSEPPAAGESRRRYYNSLYAIGDDGQILATYDKAHLVPFGEYLPFQDVLEGWGLRQITGQIGGFSSGPGLATLTVPNLPAVAPLICYEVIFPAKAIDPARRPEWIVNVTNDMWFGVTSGPHQHLAQTRMRAVEEGLPVVRAANSGISAIIDARGRVVSMLPLDSIGILDAELPRALPPTLMARFGDATFFSLLLLGFSVFLTRIKKEVRTPGLT